MGMDIFDPNHPFLPRLPLWLMCNERYVLIAKHRYLDSSHDSFNPLARSWNMPSVVSCDPIIKLI